MDLASATKDRRLPTAGPHHPEERHQEDAPGQLRPRLRAPLGRLDWLTTRRDVRIAPRHLHVQQWQLARLLPSLLPRADALLLLALRSDADDPAALSHLLRVRGRLVVYATARLLRP